MTTNGRIYPPQAPRPVAVDPPVVAQDSPPAAFQVALVSVALFAGPVLFAAVVGMVYLAAIICGQTFTLVKQGAGS